MQQFAYSESQGLDVNSEVAATIDIATKGSRPTPRSSTAYSGNGSAANAWKRPDLLEAPAPEKPKSTEPSTNGKLAEVAEVSDEQMSIADAAKELSQFGLIQTKTDNTPTELGGAGASASGPGELSGNK